MTNALAAGQLPPKPMMDALHEVCSQCKEKKVRILVNAEAHIYLKGIFLVGMELARGYNRDGYALVYNTYQAYLKSTVQTLMSHLEAAREEGFNLGVKVVRGAYMASDQRSLIHDTKQETDDAFDSIWQGVLQRQLGKLGAPGSVPFPSVDLFLASHNRESLVSAHRMHSDRANRGHPTVRLGFAQLQGMSDSLSLELIQMTNSGVSVPDVYKCSTWGTLSV